MELEFIENLAVLVPGDLIQYTWSGTLDPLAATYLFLSLENEIKSLSGLTVPGQTMNLLLMHSAHAQSKKELYFYEGINTYPRPHIYRLKETK
jgi:hypothetical protein